MVGKCRKNIYFTTFFSVFLKNVAFVLQTKRSQKEKNHERLRCSTVVVNFDHRKFFLQNVVLRGDITVFYADFGLFCLHNMSSIRRVEGKSPKYTFRFIQFINQINYAYLNIEYHINNCLNVSNHLEEFHCCNIYQLKFLPYSPVVSPVKRSEIYKPSRNQENLKLKSK